MSKKAKSECPNQSYNQGTNLFQDTIVVKELSMDPKVSIDFFLFLFFDGFSFMYLDCVFFFSRHHLMLKFWMP